MTKLMFESTVCVRCGGTGFYSTFHGVCFACGGAGSKLTKRGAAAQGFLNQLRQRPVSELQIGEKYFYAGFQAGSYSQPSCWITVESIEVQSDGSIKLIGINQRGTRFDSTCGADATERVAFTREQKVEQQNLALAYQASLNKNGKPPKNKTLVA